MTCPLRHASPAFRTADAPRTESRTDEIRRTVETAKEKVPAMTDTDRTSAPRKLKRLPPLDGFGDADSLADGLARTWQAYDTARMRAPIHHALAVRALRRFF